MNNLLAFHKSVQGSNHISWGMPCEDASGSYASPENNYYIAVVSDGHGADECYRSDKGSRIAVETALASLQELAEKMGRTPEQEKRFYQDFLGNPRYRQMTLRHLTDVIHAQWADRVLEDLRTVPPSEKELAPLQEKKKQNYALSDRPERIYGCTLIAALWMQRCLILLQQGDGRCDVFYTDGTVNQPIPWDDRCVGTQTTSLCDEDAEASFRTCVIDLQAKPVMACYLGSDGVEDSYRDSEETMAGVHTFFKGLTCEALHRTPQQLDEYLAEMLPRFSYAGLYNNAGSGDDISVAGLVDLDASRPFAASFLRDTQVYTLQEDAFWKQDAVRSKIRKHGILQRRLTEAQDAVTTSDGKRKKLQEQRADLLDDIARAKVFIAKDKKELEQIASERQSTNSDVEYLRTGNILQSITYFRRLMAFSDSLISELYDNYHLKETELHSKESNLQKLEKKLADLDAFIHDLDVHQANLEETLRQKQEEFDAYDASFRAAREAADKAQNALDTLLHTPLEETACEIPDAPGTDPVSPPSEAPLIFLPDEVQPLPKESDCLDSSSLQETDPEVFFLNPDTSESS